MRSDRYANSFSNDLKWLLMITKCDNDITSD